jgi:hypothetical protein
VWCGRVFGDVDEEVAGRGCDYCEHGHPGMLEECRARDPVTSVVEAIDQTAF